MDDLTLLGDPSGFRVGISRIVSISDIFRTLATRCGPEGDGRDSISRDARFLPNQGSPWCMMYARLEIAKHLLSPIVGKN